MRVAIQIGFGWGVIFVLGSAAFGQNPEPAGELAPLITVEARAPRPSSETSPWVSVLPWEELERRQVGSVAEALRSVPGFSIVRSGQAGGQTSLFVRGANSDHVTFLYEGRRLNGGFSGQYNLGQLGLPGAYGLEVLRGASSVAYGAEGIGGAVLLRSGPVPAQGMDSEVSLSGGSFGSKSGALRSAFREGTWSGSVVLAVSDTENNAANSDYENRQGTVRLEKRLNEAWTLDFVGMGYLSEIGLPGNNKSAGYPNLTSFQDTRHYLLSPGVTGEGDGWRGRAFYAHSSDQLEHKDTWSHSRYQADSNVLEGQWDWEPSEEWGVTVGGAVEEEAFFKEAVATGAAEVDVSRRRHSLLGLFRWMPAEVMELTVAGRLDDYSGFDSPGTWSVSGRRALWHSLSFFGRYATSFAPPQANDLYGAWGNPNLKAEEAKTWEIGARLGAEGGRLGLDLTYFQSDFDNLIQWGGVTTANVGLAESRGLEASLRAILSDSWSLRASFAYLETRDVDAGTRLVRRPRHAGDFALDYVRGGFAGGLEGRFVADRLDLDGGTFATIRGEDYVVLRAYGSYRFGERWSLFGRLENLFDADYEEADGYPALGVGAFGGLSCSF